MFIFTFAVTRLQCQYFSHAINLACTNTILIIRPLVHLKAFFGKIWTKLAIFYEILNKALEKIWSLIGLFDTAYGQIWPFYLFLTLIPIWYLKETRFELTTFQLWIEFVNHNSEPVTQQVVCSICVAFIVMIESITWYLVALSMYK